MKELQIKVRRELGPLLKKNFNSKNLEVSVLKSLAAKRVLSANRFNGFWKSIDNAKDCEEAMEIFSNKEI